VEELEAALAAGAPVRVVLLARDAPAAARAAAERAGAAGARVLAASANDLRRMSRAPAATGAGPLLALVGPDPGADAAGALAGDGAVWLLAGVAYAGNAGYAIRTAEVSGADAIFLDAALDGEGRRRALRASMHAERFFPVHWAPAGDVVAAARAAGRRAARPLRRDRARADGGLRALLQPAGRDGGGGLRAAAPGGGRRAAARVASHPSAPPEEVCR